MGSLQGIVRAAGVPQLGEGDWHFQIANRSGDYEVTVIYREPTGQLALRQCLLHEHEIAFPSEGVIDLHNLVQVAAAKMGFAADDEASTQLNQEALEQAKQIVEG